MIFYTGVPTAGTIQTDPLQSIGGLVAGNQIPNGGMNAIFPAISREHIKKNLIDVRMVVIRNVFGGPISLSIYSTRGDYSSYKLAAVTPISNTQQFEKLADGHSLPYQAELTSCEGQENAITIESLANNGLIGLWIQRTVDLSEFTELDGKPGAASLTDDELIALLQSQDLTTRTDEGAIKISYELLL